MSLDLWRARLREHFAREHAVYWANLSRTVNLLVVLNISLFFVSGLVSSQGYWFTYVSLAALGGIYLLTLVPMGMSERLGAYLTCLALLVAAGYFLAASIAYWVSQSGMTMRMPR